MTKQDEMLALVGPLIKKTSLAVLKVADERQVPAVVLSQTENLGTPFAYGYRFNSAPLSEARALASYAADYLGARYVAILYPESSKALEKSLGFWEEARKRNVEVVAFEKIAGNASDLKFAFRRISGNVRFLDKFDPEDSDTKSISSRSENIDAIYVPASLKNLKSLEGYLKAYGIDQAYLLTGTEIKPNRLFFWTDVKKWSWPPTSSKTKPTKISI